MADEAALTAPAVDSGGGDSGASAMPPASVSDTEFLNQPETAADDLGHGESTGDTTNLSGGKRTVADTEEVNLSALEEGQPEWLAKVTDPAVKAEVEKLLTYQKSFSEKFKDAADLDELFKELPGGREQVQALQTLSKEVGELDSALETNDPQGLSTIAERYFSMTPDGGVNLLRAAAQHMAKSSPESWNQVSSELVNSSLRAAGIGADLQGVVSAIAAMRDAFKTENWEDFGHAASKLIGAPKEEQKPDANLARLSERENAARAGEQKAQNEVWSSRRDAGAGKINTHIRTEAGKLLAKAAPSLSDKDRGGLLDEIAAEIGSQLSANAWTNSQVKALIGERHPDGKDGYTYQGINRTADQKAFDQAAKLLIDLANPKTITAAVAKVVSKWSTERAKSNKEARDKAKGATAKPDVGGGKPAATATRQPVSVEQLRARNQDGSLKISDREFLNL